MTISKIRAALETRLSLLSPALPTSFENGMLDAAGQPHHRVYLMPNKTATPGFDLVTKHEKGIYQVSVAYPINEGTTLGGARAELVRAHFPAGLKLTSGGVMTLIYEWPSIATGMPDGIFYVIPVSISYRAFTN